MLAEGRGYICAIRASVAVVAINTHPPDIFEETYFSATSKRIFDNTVDSKLLTQKNISTMNNHFTKNRILHQSLYVDTGCFFPFHTFQIHPNTF